MRFFFLALALLSSFGGGGGNFSGDGFGRNQASWWSRLPIFSLSSSSLERAVPVEKVISHSCCGRAPSLEARGEVGVKMLLFKFCIGICLRGATVLLHSWAAFFEWNTWRH